MNTVDQHRHLDRIASDSWYARGANARTIEYSFRVFARYISGGSILEMSPAEGVMTDLLTGLTDDLTVVEGSERFANDLKTRYPNVDVVNSLFESFRPNRQFDYIVLGHVLEHVMDPVQILSLACGWLKPTGRLLAAVPNARSIHRQAAVIMGLIEFEESMNEADRHHGHRRV